MRRLAGESRPKLVPLATRTEKREKRREAKAETAAKLETAIEAELLKRLQAGTYGDIYNFPTAQYEKALEQAVGEEGMQQPLEYVEGDDESEEEDVQLVPEEELELEEQEEDDLEDLVGRHASSNSEPESTDAEDLIGQEEAGFRGTGQQQASTTAAQHPQGQPTAKRRRRPMEIEYEEEREPPARHAVGNARW